MLQRGDHEPSHGRRQEVGVPVTVSSRSSTGTFRPKVSERAPSSEDPLDVGSLLRKILLTVSIITALQEAVCLTALHSGVADMTQHRGSPCPGKQKTVAGSDRSTRNQGGDPRGFQVVLLEVSSEAPPSETAVVTILTISRAVLEATSPREARGNSV